METVHRQHLRRDLIRQSAIGTAALGFLAACGKIRPTRTAEWQPLEDQPLVHTAAVYSGLGGTPIRMLCTSRFFGYEAAVSRAYTNYGWTWGTATSQLLPPQPAAQVLAADVLGQGTDAIVVYAPETRQVAWYPPGTSEPAGHYTLPGEGSLVAGDFRGLGHADLGLFDAQAGVLHLFWGNGSGGFTTGKSVRLSVRGGQLIAADFNGDGVADLCAYGQDGTISVFWGDGHGGFTSPTRSQWPGATGSGHLVAGDFAQNHRADLALYQGHGYPQGFEFRLNQGNGVFGPTSAQMETPALTHLWATYPWSVPDALAFAGRLNGTSAAIALWNPSTGIVSIAPLGGVPAYNYSVSLMRQANSYRLWYGGRWQTLNQSGVAEPNWDGDHVLSASSPDGVRWFRDLAAPAMYQGAELGQTGWWTGNYLQPQVLLVGGTYHMFWQAEVNPGQVVDTGQVATAPADRIGLSTSRDGVHWTRMTSRGVVVNLPDPAITKLGDEEALYVADDPDHLPWWLYVFYFLNGQAQGYVRLRSDDPTTFDWNQREPTQGLSQIGNGSAYCDTPSGRVYLRITFVGSSTLRTYAALQLSRDGLQWAFGTPTAFASGDSNIPPLALPGVTGGITLASSRNTANNRNVYFLGISSLDGTGQLVQTGKNTYQAYYAATTADEPTAPEIFSSQIGIGTVTIQFP